MFKHFGESVAELINLDESVADCLNAPENKAAFELLRESLGEDLGVIVVSGHIGNWELMAQAFSAAGFPVSSVAKPTYDPRLTALVDEFRGRNGMKTLWRGQTEIFKAILKVFQNRETFGILIDQDTKGTWRFRPVLWRACVYAYRGSNNPPSHWRASSRWLSPPKPRGTKN